MKPIYIFASLILIGGAVAWYVLHPVPAEDAQAEPSATVSAMQVTRQETPRLILAEGSISAGAAEQSLTLQAGAMLTAYDVTQGEAVRQGQILAMLAPDPIEAANLQKAQNALNAAQAARQHIAALLPTHLATDADLATAEQNLRDAKAALSALRASGAGQAYALRAPADGIVTALAAAPGGTLPAGTMLVKFAPADAMLARIGLAQDEAGFVHIGDDARLMLLNGGASVPAKVVSVAAALDPVSGLVTVTLRPQMPVSLGAPVRASIQAGQLDGMTVPNGAVLRDEQGTYVYQLDSSDVAHRMPANVLQQGNAQSVLAPSLNASWKLATDGAYQLSDGMRATLTGAGS